MNANRILLPFDFSEHSRACLDWVAEMLVGAPDQEFHVVFVLRTPSDYVGWEGDPRNSLEDELEGVARAFGAKVERTTRSHVLKGHPATEICGHATVSGCDLIVMATRGRTGVRHLMLGSTTEQVVRHSDVAVITKRFKSAG